MSQEDVLEIIKELGGRATTSQIVQRAKAKFPTRTLHMYVVNRLKKLEKWGVLSSEAVEHLAPDPTAAWKRNRTRKETLWVIKGDLKPSQE